MEYSDWLARDWLHSPSRNVIKILVKMSIKLILVPTEHYIYASLQCKQYIFFTINWQTLVLVLVSMESDHCLPIGPNYCDYVPLHLHASLNIGKKIELFLFNKCGAIARNTVKT